MEFNSKQTKNRSSYGTSTSSSLCQQCHGKKDRPKDPSFGKEMHKKWKRPNENTKTFSR